MARLTDSNDWFNIWFQDKQSILSTMIMNMQADLEAGYNYFGQSITKQREEIDAYKKQFDEEVDMFKRLDEEAVNRWCFYDMKKRGAID